MDPAKRWLLTEGILPLLGAGVLYLALGCGRYLVASNKKKFTYRWKEAIDSLGWLYGAVIISVQAGLRGSGNQNAGMFPLLCFIASAICLLVLICAMTERGQAPAWEPPTSLKVAAGVLAGAILWAGFQVQSIVLSGAKP